MTDPNQYNPQNPQQAQQYGGYGSYGQNDYGQQAPQYGAPQYSAPQYGNAAGYNQQQPQYGAPQPQPQGSGSFFALTAPLDQPAYNCTIGEAFIRFWKKYATFKGRASRGEFWWWVLCTFIIQIAFAVIFAVLGAIIDSNTANGMQSFVNTIWALATIVPSLALSVRRLHDTNKAGTTLVILYAIDFIGGVLLSVGLVMTGLGAISVIGGGSSSTGAAGILLLIIGFIACLATSIVLIVLMAKKTDPAGARFDDPAAGNGYAPAPGMPPTATAQYAPNGTPAPVADPYAAAVPTPTADPYTAAAPAPAMPAPTPAMPTADPYGAPTPAPAATNTPYGNPYGGSLRNSDRSVRSTCDASRSSRPVHSGRPGNSACSPGTRAPSMPSMPPLPTVPEQSTQLDQTQFDRPTFGNDSQGQTPYGSDNSDDSDDPTVYGNIQH